METHEFVGTPFQGPPSGDHALAHSARHPSLVQDRCAWWLLIDPSGQPRLALLGWWGKWEREPDVVEFHLSTNTWTPVDPGILWSMPVKRPVRP